jgi:hypothetical protein
MSINKPTQCQYPEHIIQSLICFYHVYGEVCMGASSVLNTSKMAVWTSLIRKNGMQPAANTRLGLLKDHEGLVAQLV